MTLIELHSMTGPIWINPEYISSLSATDYGSAVFVANDTEPVIVKDKPKKFIVVK